MLQNIASQNGSSSQPRHLPDGKETGDLFRQPHDKKVQLGMALDEIPRVLRRLDLPKGASPPTGGGGSSTMGRPYALTFRTVAASSRWNEQALRNLFRRGLHEELQMEHCETTPSHCTRSSRLSAGWITSNGSVDTPIASLPPSFVDRSESESEPMEVGSTRFPTAERPCRRQLGLCPYCGQEGHQLQWCLLHSTYLHIRYGHKTQVSFLSIEILSKQLEAGVFPIELNFYGMVCLFM